jgi:hypothetical protein
MNSIAKIHILGLVNTIYKYGSFATCNGLNVLMLSYGMQIHMITKE